MGTGSLRRRSSRVVLATIGAAALILGACGTEPEGDDDAVTQPETGDEAADPAETADPAEETGDSPEEASEADAAGVASVEPLQEEATIRLAITQNQILTLPLWMAIEEGWFEDAGINLETDVYRGSSNEQIPRMATGEIDVSLATPSPALYNQIAEGFGIQVIASLGVEEPGRIAASWLTVLAEQAEEIQELEDMAGKRVEGTRQGSPPALLVIQALEEAGLSPDDVELTYRVQAPPDMYALAEAGAADVIGMNEPLATQAEEAGLVVKWQSSADIMPWFQPGLLAASPEFIEANPEAVSKFLEVYLAACEVVNATDGEWTDDLIAVIENNLETAPDEITAQGGVPLFSPTGEISQESLERVQEIYLDNGLLENEIDPPELIAEDVLAQAVAERQG